MKLQKALTKKAVLAALKELGTTEKAVAAALGRRRCKGPRGSHDTCPVARYLHKKFAQRDVLFSVSARNAAFGKNGSPAYVSVPIPSAVAGFISAFDDDQYPNLAAECQESRRD